MHLNLEEIECCIQWATSYFRQQPVLTNRDENVYLKLRKGRETLGLELNLFDLKVIQVWYSRSLENPVSAGSGGTPLYNYHLIQRIKTYISLGESSEV